ncbi:apoptosis-inducing factor 1, mitochondrial isoform X2 [Leptopilina boulardi]|uniref:apoptosis-inducing factor 1, mitochondrial isoform X2 n=1 Tax=Leptopilina boulardi TaxID=63433 RepID=UPI0021F54184|nr:apoptosis-inducing factor 1, mitochondrial isoform X2 [Leptopilina boulardi]
MLSCGKVIGQLTKITRHLNNKHFSGTIKYVGIINIHSTRLNSTREKKPYRFSGVTLKAEECVPKGGQKKKFAGPACELGPDSSCPTTCPGATFPHDPKNDNDGNGPFKYWKELFIALFLTGVVIFSFAQLGNDNGKLSKEKDNESERKKRRKIVKYPKKSSLIPKEIPYLLIGGGPASFSAFRSIKSNDPKAKVLIITNESYNPYMKPPLSKEVWYDKDRTSSSEFSFKQWHGTPRSFFYEPAEFFTPIEKLNEFENGGVSVATGWKVDKIDVINKIVTLSDGYQIKYEKCLLATGSTPKNLEIFESADEKVTSKILPYRTLDDYLELEANVHDPNVRNIVIIGGGFLGSELACSMAQNFDPDKKRVIQICKEKNIMAQVLPEYLSEWTTNKAKAIGVHFIGNTEVEDFEMRDGKLTLITTENKRVDADQVIVAVGAKANTDLATVSELETESEIGGFLVNAELEARSNLWVAGDAACFYDIKFGRRRVEHYDHAIISGRLAGENMTGARKPYKHQSMFWSDLGLDIGYEAIGIIDSKLPTVSVFLKKDEKKEVEISEKLTKKEEEEEKEDNLKNESKKNIEKLNDSSVQTNDNEKCDDVESLSSTRKDYDLERGIIFYLKNDIVVGIVLWNVFSRMSIARQVLERGTKYEELSEISKLFTMHED